MMARYANVARVALAAAALAIAPAPPIDLEAWAVENLKFTERESEFTGSYQPDLFPYFSAVLAALGTDDPCRITTLCGSAQIGKTVCLMVFVLSALDRASGAVMVTHPTTENAQRWSKLKLDPMLRGIERLASQFPRRSRDGGDSVLMKRRADGRAALLISGANSPASLSQVSMPRQAQDDLSKWETHPTAGDPERMADTRSESREFAKIFKTSTPLVAPGCRITDNFNAGSQETFHVPCPHCGHFHALEWENFKASLDVDRPDHGFFTCPECGGIIEEHHRAAMVRQGRMVAGNPAAMRYHRSFYIWSAYSPLQSWARIARAWHAAAGDSGREQVFLNDIVGRAHETAGSAPPADVLEARAREGHRRGVIPDGFAVVVMGIDVQGDRVEWQVVALDRHGRRAVIDVGVVYGHISEPDMWPLLDGVLARQFPTVAGSRLAVDRAAIDGNAYTEDVWSWARRHPVSKVIMVRGVPGDNVPLVKRVKRERRLDGRLLKYSRRFYNFAADTLKLRLYRDLEREDLSARGAVLLPAGLDKDYFEQLTAERRARKVGKDGFATYRWVKAEHQANEALDTMNQATVAALTLQVPLYTPEHWAKLEAERFPADQERQGDLEDLMAAAAAVADADRAVLRKAMSDGSARSKRPAERAPKRRAMREIGGKGNG